MSTIAAVANKLQFEKTDVGLIVDGLTPNLWSVLYQIRVRYCMAKDLSNPQNHIVALIAENALSEELPHINAVMHFTEVEICAFNILLSWYLLDTPHKDISTSDASLLLDILHHFEKHFK